MLELSPQTRTVDEVKKAYRSLARKYHPDMNPGDAKALERFREVTAAYDYITDNYDGNLTQEKTQEAPNPFVNPSAAAKSNPPPPPKRQGQASNASLHLKYSLSVSLEEAANGATKTIHYARIDFHQQKEVVKLAVKVPAGIKEGQKLRIKGEGSRNGKDLPGDLYVFINIEPHPVFTKDGRNIKMDLPITLKESIFGCEKTVPTLYGIAKVTLAPNTTTGKVLRLKNRGYPRVEGFGKGDQLIRILIDVPTEFTDEEKNWIEKISLKPSPLIKKYEISLSKIKR